MTNQVDSVVCEECANFGRDHGYEHATDNQQVIAVEGDDEKNPTEVPVHTMAK